LQGVRFVVARDPRSNSRRSRIRILLQQAANARSDEIRAFFAMQAFGRRKPLRDLEPRLRRDIKAFFGSLGVAEAEGRRLLHQCADVEAIKAACERAASMGLGWLDADHSLQLHTSLVPRLDPSCVCMWDARRLYGDVLSADLVKIHIQSGKVTLMKFDDFVGKPVATHAGTGEGEAPRPGFGHL
jgi:DNA phosphorothioation-associated putative methyltransferase